MPTSKTHQVEQHAILIQQGIQSVHIENMQKKIEDIEKKLDEVLVFVNETKGGHKYLWGMLTLASTLGATIGSAATYFKFN